MHSWKFLPFVVASVALSRGEGCCLYQGDNGIHSFDCGEIAGFCHCGASARVLGDMSVRTRKRSFKRASRRAVRDGFAVYRGQRLTREMILAQASQQFLGTDRPTTMPKSVRTKRLSPGQSTRAKRIQVFNWNSGGLSGDSYDTLLSLLERMQILVAQIQETHWSFSSTWSTNSYHCIQSGGGKPGTGGCLTLIHKQLCHSSQVKFHSVVPGRLLHVRIPVGSSYLNCLNVYQFYVARADRDDDKHHGRAEVLHQMDNVLSRVP